MYKAYIVYEKYTIACMVYTKCVHRVLYKNYTHMYFKKYTINICRDLYESMIYQMVDFSGAVTHFFAG